MEERHGVLDSVLWVTGVKPNVEFGVLRAADHLLTHCDSVCVCVRVEA